MTSIAATVSTPRHYDANRPFGAAHMTKQPVKLTDPSTLEICNDPLPAARASSGKKYEPTFKAMQPGQAIKCLPSEIGRIGGAMRKFVDTYMLDTADVHCAESGQYLGQCRMSDYDVLRMTDVVLTIAHLDHVPENCDPENLRAWCQRCHLRYDAAHHAATANQTRRSGRAMADLFDAV